MDAIIGEIQAVNSWRAGVDFESKYEKVFHKTLDTFTAEEKSRIDTLLLEAIKCGNSNVLNVVAIRILEKRKLIEWKNRPDLVNRVVDAVIESCQHEAENKKHFTSFMQKFMETLTNLNQVERHCEKIFQVTRAAFSQLENTSADIHKAALPCITKFPWKERTEFIPEMVSLMLKAVKECSDVSEGEWLCINCEIALPMMFNQQHGTSVQKLVLNDVTEMFNICLNHDWQSESDPSKHNLAYKMLASILENYLKNGSAGVELVRPMIEGIKELWECGDSQLQRDANYIITAMAGEADLTGDSTDALLENYLKNKDPSIGAKLKDIYKEQPEKVHEFLPRFVTSLAQENDVMQMMPIQMLTEVAKSAPDRISKEAIEVVAAKMTHDQLSFIALMFLDAVADHRPNEVVKYEPDIIKIYESVEATVGIAGGLIVKIALTENQKKRFMNIFFARLTTISGMFQISVLNNIRQLGVGCPHILAQHRATIEKLKAQPTLTDMCQATLDVIDGRTLEKVSNEVSGQRKDINQLDARVTNNEGEISNVKIEVGENRVDINNIRTDVNDQGQKLGDLKHVVDDTVQRVDELERKTLSHAPTWSREVARLIGPASDRDWRLLAGRLGYTNDDIRNWATQPDPCLSMLDEWFAAHNTREATHAVRKILVEINRTDASDIIDNALKSVQHVITEDVSEPPVAPPIFLSYQWAHQPEVKLLRRHLGLAGYASWMDIGQMGGGDKLFAKIDAGIRAAKIVICCISQKYSESLNCNREVNLTTALGKPVIPLLMENMQWPPSGAMGPIFGEYIYIRFFQGDGEKRGDDRYWPTEKFTELLMQLRYYVAPEAAAIPDNSRYLNWWQPPEEIIIITPKTNNTSTGVVSSNETKAIQEGLPEVFISYQWDKQEEIKALYQRLTGHGFKCWLDILQMGGGDGLYEKIDHGIRNCKVVVSCVTSKYAKSPNCRREVSLTDALKKPIIPLLLEELQWPPEGPMSPVLTQLLYIGFTKPSAKVHSIWECEEFNQLLQQISLYSKPQYVKEHVEQKKEPALITATQSERLENTNKNSAIVSSQSRDIKDDVRGEGGVESVQQSACCTIS